MKRSGIARRTPLPRATAPLARTTRVKATNPLCKREAFARAYGGAERVDWIKGQPSILSGARPCVNAHVKTGGMGRKADARWIVPLTAAEHDELHRIGQRTFEAKYAIDLAFWAQVIDARWEAYRAAPDTLKARPK